jgi:hypothetical protein
MAESSAGLLLAAVRCLEMTAPKMANRLFRGRRIQLWLLAVPLYACWRFLFTRPCLFNAIFFQWFFNPFKGYLEDAQSLVIKSIKNILKIKKSNPKKSSLSSAIEWLKSMIWLWPFFFQCST